MSRFFAPAAFALAVALSSGCAALDRTCDDTGTTQWVVISVEHAEQPATYIYAVDADGTPERVAVSVTRDGETLFEQEWSPDYAITTDKMPGCGQDGMRADVVASF